MPVASNNRRGFRDQHLLDRVVRNAGVAQRGQDLAMDVSMRHLGADTARHDGGVTWL